jgi:hypothetical protein
MVKYLNRGSNEQGANVIGTKVQVGVYVTITSGY